MRQNVKIMINAVRRHDEFRKALISGLGLSTRKDGINTISKYKLNFINIDFLNSWIGSLIYIIFMLLSILALNSQQRYLIKINSFSTEPVILEKTINKN